MDIICHYKKKRQHRQKPIEPGRFGPRLGILEENPFASTALYNVCLVGCIPTGSAHLLDDLGGHLSHNARGSSRDICGGRAARMGAKGPLLSLSAGQMREARNLGVARRRMRWKLWCKVGRKGIRVWRACTKGSW